MCYFIGKNGPLFYLLLIAILSCWAIQSGSLPTRYSKNSSKTSLHKDQKAAMERNAPKSEVEFFSGKPDKSWFVHSSSGSKKIRSHHTSARKSSSKQHHQSSSNSHTSAANNSSHHQSSSARHANSHKASSTNKTNVMIEGLHAKVQPSETSVVCCQSPDSAKMAMSSLLTIMVSPNQPLRHAATVTSEGSSAGGVSSSGSSSQSRQQPMSRQNSSESERSHASVTVTSAASGRSGGASNSFGHKPNSPKTHSGNSSATSRKQR